MDNRSIAAFIEKKKQNETRMKSVIICLPSRGAGQYPRNGRIFKVTQMTIFEHFAKDRFKAK